MDENLEDELTVEEICPWQDLMPRESEDPRLITDPLRDYHGEDIHQNDFDKILETEKGKW